MIFIIKICHIAENKTYLAEVENKNIKLNEHLKEVYVKSNDGVTQLRSENRSEEKLLPVKRTSDFFELGYKESKIIPVGRVSLMQAMKFISDHGKNASVWTVEKIADDNKLKRDVAGKISWNTSVPNCLRLLCLICEF